MYTSGRAVFLKAIALVLLSNAFPSVASVVQVHCLENGRFYRDPATPLHKVWSEEECGKYFLCLENEVFEFRCTAGLLFDVIRQICDVKLNVDNCDIPAGKEYSSPLLFDKLRNFLENIASKPLLKESNCHEKDQLDCADGVCLPKQYFCDGSVDCVDGSDEEYCNLKEDPYAAGFCNFSNCKLPSCFCSEDGKQIPSDLDPIQTPQMILLTFDDAIDSENWDLYTKSIFTAERQNPNGCPLKGTFFISHQHNNYHLTQKLWNNGHEIAVHSITHRQPGEWWSKNATVEDWFDEMVGSANILKEFASVRLSDIRGLRVPFFQTGWNRQFLMMKEFGFIYDSSIIGPFSNPPLWPYTLDYRMPHNCSDGQSCPTRPFSRIWEMVINQLNVKGRLCFMINSCLQNYTLTADELYKTFLFNFNRHYLTNRAPFGLYLHSEWFKNIEYLEVFQKFMDTMMQYPDVWFVTNWQAIEWMKHPTPLNHLISFEPWTCKQHFDPSEIACHIPNTCRLYSRIFQEDRYIHTCKKCPQKYPWIKNEFGNE